MKVRTRLVEALTEQRARTSDLLKVVAQGQSSRVEGMKLDRKTAQKLLALYRNMSTGGQADFDKMTASKITLAFKNYL